MGGSKMTRFQVWMSSLILLFAITATSPATADVQTAYQGRLTNPAGDPVPDDFYLITFYLYDVSTGGIPVWTEAHPDVETTDGFFDAVLGSLSPLAESVFETEPLYLGIQVAGDPELAPRTLMTSVPKAAMAKSVKGDIETSVGFMELKNSSGTSAFSLDATAGSGPAYLKLHNTSLDFPGQRLAQLSTEDDGGAFSLYPAGDIPNNPYLKIGFNDSPSFQGWMEFLDPTGSFPVDPYIRMGVEPSPFTGAKFEMYDPGSGFGDHPYIRMGTEPSPFNRASFKMFNPQPEPPRMYLMMETSQDNGPSFGMYDDIGQVMGFEPMPFNSGFGLKLFNAQAMEPLDHPVVEMTSVYDVDGASGRVALHSELAGEDNDSAVVTANGLALYDGIQQVATLNLNGLEVLSLECGPAKGGAWTAKYTGCGSVIVDDTTSDTLASYTPNGAFLGGSSDKSLATAYFTSSALKLTGGSTGYVLTSDAYGVGTWQAASGGTDSDWCDDGTVLSLCNQRGIAGKYNTLYGSADTTHVNLGINNTTGLSGSTRRGCTITGGENNTASGGLAFVGSGNHNSATNSYSVVTGGYYNLSGHSYATVGGGHTCEATGNAATIAGGWDNSAGGYYSTIPGGSNNTANGEYSYASGYKAKALHDGSMVFCANTNSNDSVMSGGNEQMVFYADGGIFITDSTQTAPYDVSKLINTKTGAYLSWMGVWTNSSSREFKENYQPVDSYDILNRIDQLPITKWNYKGDKEVSHIGPIAEDFYEIFGVGNDNKSVSTVDPSGIALAGVKGLIEENRELKTVVSDLLKRIEALESQATSDK